MNKKRLLNYVLVGLGLIIALLVIHKLVTHKTDVPLATVAPPTASIQLGEDGFEPATIKIKKGTAVIWKNIDTQPHRVAANPFPSHSELPALDSKTNIAPSANYVFTFTSPGTFHYHDELNPDQNGTIVVE